MPSPRSAAVLSVTGRTLFRTGADLASVLSTVQPTPAAAARALASSAAAHSGAPATVAARTPDGQWEILHGPPELPGGYSVAAALPPAVLDGEPLALPGGVAVSAAEVAVVLHGAADLTELRELLTQACVWLTLHRDRDAAVTRVGAAGEEISVLRAVTEQLLSVRDLDQVLLSIASRTLRLLDSDICGVLLREGDELRMRSCVGHRIIDTARLRMRRGQGVAGRVFLTGQPAKVDEYLEDRTISTDFMSLAEQEQCQSALAVPLRLEGEMIGVLEVWRRRPSVFTDDDVRRLVTLADFATIAIRNARLYDEQASTVEQLQEARDALESQVGVLRRSAALQRTLLTDVLEGAGLAVIGRTVARELGCQVAIYGPEGQRVSRHPTRPAGPDLPTSLRPHARRGAVQLTLSDGSTVPAWMHPVVAEGDWVGAVCLVCPEESPQVMEIASVQTAMACSLAHLQQRAASRARAVALEQIFWDLLQGPVEHRIAARSRAQQMGVTLVGPHRVLYGRLENIEELAAEHGWDTSETDRVRREILRALQQCHTASRLALVSLRGDWLVAVAPVRDAGAVRDLVEQLRSAARGVRAGLATTWGVSRTHDDPLELPSAFGEAKIALSAAHRLGSESVFLYEELGIVRLLLGSGNDPDLQTFIREVTGPLVEYDREHDGSLIRTLRTFFDADCSQKVAAQRLFVHHKTLRYRLERIKQLTGLDLSRHEDRMRADFALRLMQVTEASEGDIPLPPAR